jgi:S-adenosylmethionine:tRNA ribosyltransferase-isomerase
VLRTADLEYELPAGRIATHPAHPRDSAALMVAARAGRAAPAHTHVSHLPDFLRPGDLLVLNRTSVLPARFVGRNEGTGAKVQGLYLSPAAAGEAGAESGGSRRWRVLLKMRRFRSGARLILSDRHARTSDVVLVLEERAGEDDGGWIVRVESPDAAAVTDERVLARVGLAPLPPYILASRREEENATPDDTEVEQDLATYQTVYADPSRAGSVAAPTAGLHFTPELLARLDSMGVRTAEVVLHVGMGTFKPIESEHVEQHPMHAEWCTLPAATARAIEATRRAGGRVIAVGTTSARTLESFPDLGAIVEDASMATRLLITPGHRFRNLDGLLTNFHLPRSTLLALVGAMFDGGVPRLLELYKEAIGQGYRFYSFGDAMLVV